MSTEELGWLAAVGLALVVGMGIGRAQAGAGTRRRARRRQTRAIKAEHAAGKLLMSLGYRIVDEQVQASLQIDVNGAPMDVDVRADYLVYRDGLHYIAEVKSGDLAPSLQHANTRRQLLEYSLAYAVDGTLLVDMEAQAVHAVAFPLAMQAPVSNPPFLLRGVVWALAGAFAARYAGEHLPW